MSRSRKHPLKQPLPSYLFAAFYGGCSGIAAALALHWQGYLWISLLYSVGAAIFGLVAVGHLLDAWWSR